MKPKKTIVGIDPGTTAAVAVLNLKGKLLAIESRKNFGKNEMIKFISSTGSPTVMATDKALTPSLIMKISSNFNSFTFSPEKDLSLEEKRDLTREYDTKNSHQRDALASALYAYEEHRETIKKIERTLEGLNMWKYVDEVKDMILRGRCTTVSEAIERVLSKKSKVRNTRASKTKKMTRGEVESILGKLRESLKEKEKTIGILERYSGKLEKRVEELEKENKKLSKKKSAKKPRKKVPNKIKNKIRNLENMLEKKREKQEEKEELVRTLRKIEETRKGGMVPVKICENAGQEKLKEMEKTLGIKKDVIYFKKYSRIGKKFIENLKKNEIEVIIGVFPENWKKRIEKEGITVLDREDVEIELKKNYGILDPESLKKEKKKSFMEWLKKYRKRFE